MGAQGKGGYDKVNATGGKIDMLQRSAQSRHKYCEPAGLLNHYGYEYFERTLRQDIVRGNSCAFCHRSHSKRRAYLVEEFDSRSVPLQRRLAEIADSSYVDSISIIKRFFLASFWDRPSLMLEAAKAIRSPYDVIRVANEGIAQRSKGGLESAIDLLALLDDSELLRCVIDERAFNASIQSGVDVDLRAMIIARSMARHHRGKVADKLRLLDSVLAQNRAPIVAEAIIDSWGDLVDLGMPKHDALKRLDKIASAYGNLGGVNRLVEEAKQRINDY